MVLKNQNNKKTNILSKYLLNIFAFFRDYLISGELLLLNCFEILIRKMLFIKNRTANIMLLVVIC